MVCPLGCGQELTNKDDNEDLSKTLAHYEICPNRIIDCQICGLSHPINQPGGHMQCVVALTKALQGKDQIIDNL